MSSKQRAEAILCGVLKINSKSVWNKIQCTMPSSGTEFTSASLLCFILLGIIRGTFSVVIHFAVRSYKSPSLVFLLRTPGTVVLYIVLLVFWSVRSDEMKRMFLNNFKNVRCYWKLAVMGLVQLAAPYMLFMRGLKVLNPTVGGVFMAAAPWTTILLERLPFIRVCIHLCW